MEKINNKIRIQNKEKTMNTEKWKELITLWARNTDDNQALFSFTAGGNEYEFVFEGHIHDSIVKLARIYNIFFKTKEEQIRAIEEDPRNIKLMKNPCEEAQLKVIEKYPIFFKYIEKPTPKVQLEAVKRQGDLIRFIEKPSQKLQLIAIKQFTGHIKFIKKPTKKIQLMIAESEWIEDITFPCEEAMLKHIIYNAKLANPEYDLKPPEEIC